MGHYRIANIQILSLIRGWYKTGTPNPNADIFKVSAEYEINKILNFIEATKLISVSTHPLKQKERR